MTGDNIMCFVILVLLEFLPISVLGKLRGVKSCKDMSLGIVGGQESDIGDFPGLVSLQRSYHHFCGGTLINEIHVLTAAHCMFHFKGGPIKHYQFHVMAGDLSVSLEDVSRDRIYRDPELIFVHVKYDPRTHRNDIAMIRLDMSILVVPKVIEVIPLASEVFKVDTTCKVAGWGHTSERATVVEDYQRKVNIVIMPNSFCEKAYSSFKFGIMICSGTYWGGKDACQGDSGGGLLCGGLLAGVVSYGRGCGRVSCPGVYTNVMAFKSWIAEYTNFSGSQKDVPMPFFINSAQSLNSNFIPVAIFVVQTFVL